MQTRRVAFAEAVRAGRRGAEDLDDQREVAYPDPIERAHFVDGRDEQIRFCTSTSGVQEMSGGAANKSHPAAREVRVEGIAEPFDTT